MTEKSIQTKQAKGNIWPEDIVKKTKKQTQTNQFCFVLFFKITTETRDDLPNTHVTTFPNLTFMKNTEKSQQPIAVKQT